MRNTDSKAIRKTQLAATISAILAALAASPVTAQESSAPAAEDGAVTLEEVIVTASRREQNLQDVPVSVTAVSGETVSNSNFREVTDIQYLAPNVTFSATNPVSNGGGYQLRGIGTQTYDSGVEQSVGLVVDGVVIGLSRDPGATGFGDIERLEVLRGPQGTLFGKNASAGVIQVVTRSPQLGENSADLDLSYGERNEQIARGTANVAMGDQWALRVTGFYQAQDGAIPYVVRKHGAVGDRENQGVRAKLLWEPADALSLLLTAEHQDGFARDAQTIEKLGINPQYNIHFASFEQQPGHGVYKSYQDGDVTADTSIDGAALQVDYGIGAYTLTSITAYRELETISFADIDGVPVDAFNHSDGGVDSNQFTEELRLTSPAGERLEYVMGAYYYKTENTGSITQYGNLWKIFPPVPPFIFIPHMPIVIGSGTRDQSGTNTSYALFGQGTYGLTDTLKLIAGLRYTNDEVTSKVRVTPLPFPAFPLTTVQPYDGQFDADNVSGRIGLQYEPTDALMLYATFATGYKGPAVDTTGAGEPREVKPETVESYELGVRSTLLDGRMTLNATLYSSDYKDFQAQTLDTSVTPPVFGLANAGLMRARGVELETTWRATEYLDLSVAAAYNDAEFREFVGPCYAGQPESPDGCYTDPESGSKVANYAGERLTNAPEWSYILRGSYRYPFGNGLMFDANANWAWRSEAQAVVADPNAQIDSYGLLNANLGLGDEDGKWRIAVYARNLLDEQFYAPYAASSLGNAGGYNRMMSPDAFRTVGATLSLHF